MNQSVQKLSEPQIAEGRDILYRYYCDSVALAGVMQQSLGVEGRIAAKVQFENIEFALTSCYDRLDNIDGELELIDYKTTKNPTIPDGIDVQLGLYYLASQQVYR
ncbi:MAG TPA: PD-(D/E)XK nuclease family protein [Stenomitos sp.]